MDMSELFSCIWLGLATFNLLFLSITDRFGKYDKNDMEGMDEQDYMSLMALVCVILAPIAFVIIIFGVIKELTKDK